MESEMKAIASLVVRGTDHNVPHGGLYLADFEEQRGQKVFDWDVPIRYDGRGSERGLRSVKVISDTIYVAAHSSMVVLDKEFNLLEEVKTVIPFAHFHEACLYGGEIYLAATAIESVVAFSVAERRFTKGWKLDMARKELLPFDPTNPKSLAAVHVDTPCNEQHINTVFVDGGKLYAYGANSGWVIELGLENNKAEVAALLPLSCHNIQSLGCGLVFTEAYRSCVTIWGPNPEVPDWAVYQQYRREATFPVPTPDTNAVEDGVARPGWVRGLSVLPDRLIVGTTPAALTLVPLFRPADKIEQVQLSDDVRHTIHGIDVWPFDMPRSKAMTENFKEMYGTKETKDESPDDQPRPVRKRRASRRRRDTKKATKEALASPSKDSS
jgi:hypothetical protein